LGTDHAGQADLPAAMARLRDSLTLSIRTSFSRKPGQAHIKLPVPEIEFADDEPASYAPYRRFHEAHQRDMEQRIAPLRSLVRDALTQASPRLAKLAELDATLEKILRPREGKLLARVPALLQPRFDRLYQEHRQSRIAAGQTDKPADWMRTGGWLARFCENMQALLLAELAFRLQPATGLIDAYRHDMQ
jgi:hypothetical protein